ncbi:hypothetical protein BRARA_G00599 [Brassica rapa]|uniref:Uncharacterized protein n=1 Tax=Brassica campestris TaxID=3711 RepID=A0A397YIG5_BRACM|nr:hypothetical protein BRARA_G00599 [Brassica rapa]
MFKLQNRQRRMGKKSSSRGQRREEREHEDMWAKEIQRQRGNGKREGTRRMIFFP